MEGMKKLKFWDEFLDSAFMLVSRAIVNQLT